MKLGDLVYIKWEDSVGCLEGWARIEDVRGVSVSEVESVGWVSAITRRGVQLVPHLVVKNAGGAMGVLTIPRSAILATQIIEPISSLRRVFSRAPAPSLRR